MTFIFAPLRARNRPRPRSFLATGFRGRLRVGVVLGVLSLGMLAACNRMIAPRQTQLAKDADARAAEGDYAQAINLYESALDGTPASAEIHYKLALIYDDKLNDPLNALHHFKRVLSLEPSGKRAQEVKGFMKRDELTLLTDLTGDSMVPRAEVARLNNENLSLRQQLGERWAADKLAAQQRSGIRKKGQPNEKRKPGGPARSYTVQPGDTLASIARKFYKSSARWSTILEANSDVISKPADLKPGQTLVIP